MPVSTKHSVIRSNNVNRRDFIDFPILWVSCLSFWLQTNRSGEYEVYNFKEFICTNMEESKISLINIYVTIIRARWLKKTTKFNVTLRQM